MPKLTKKQWVSGKSLTKGNSSVLHAKFKAKGKKKVNAKAVFKLIAKKKVAPPAGADVSVGVLDIGQGSCNLVFAPDFTFYFDIGRPNHWYTDSQPLNLTACTTSPGLIVLSHWDRDHWYLGDDPLLHVKPWYVPVQPVGGGTLAAYNRIRAASIDFRVADFPEGQVVEFGPVTLLRARTTPGVLEELNTTGLAAAINTRLAAPRKYVLLTGDAGFSEFGTPAVGVPPLIRASLKAITAPHHGGHTNDVQADIVPPATPPVLGSIAFSYGIRPDGSHCYGHPLPGPGVLYHNALWRTFKNTAEDDLRTGAVAQRGNVLIGAFNPAVGDLDSQCTCAPVCSFKRFRAAKILRIS